MPLITKKTNGVAISPCSHTIHNLLASQSGMKGCTHQQDPARCSPCMWLGHHSSYMQHWLQRSGSVTRRTGRC